MNAKLLTLAVYFLRGGLWVLRTAVSDQVRPALRRGARIGLNVDKAIAKSHENSKSTPKPLPGIAKNANGISGPMRLWQRLTRFPLSRRRSESTIFSISAMIESKRSRRPRKMKPFKDQSLLRSLQLPRRLSFSPAALLIALILVVLLTPNSTSALTDSRGRMNHRPASEMSLAERVEEGEAIVAEMSSRHSYKTAYKFNHPGQIAFHSDTHRIRACFTGNRWGKTYAAVKEMDWWAIGDHPYRETPEPPVRLRSIADGFVYGIDKVILPALRRLIDPRRLFGGSWESGYEAGKNELHFTPVRGNSEGSTIQFMSYSQKDQGRAAQKFEGDVLDLFWPDEHCPIEIIDACRSRIGSRPVHEIYTLTPVLGKTWEYKQIYQPWERGDAPDIMCFLGEGVDNPEVSTSALEAMYARILDPQMRKVRRKGMWINLGGSVYGLFNPDVHVVRFDPAIVARLTKTTIIDPHPSKPEAILWCGIDHDNRRYAYREALIAKPVPMVCDEIRTLSAGERINRWLFDFHGGNWVDKERGKSKRQMYEEAGLGPFLPGHSVVSDRIERLRQMFHVPAVGGPLLYIMDSCPLLAEQAEENKFKPQTQAMREGDRWKRIEENDDLLDCLEYYAMSDDVYIGQGKPAPASVAEDDIGMSQVMQRLLPREENQGNESARERRLFRG